MSVPSEPLPLPVVPVSATDAIPLSGSWRVALDPQDRGQRERWFTDALPDAAVVTLPGSLAVQRIGYPVRVETAWTGTIFDSAFYEAPAHACNRTAGQIRVPFFLQPDRVYVGAAWYQRLIDLPPAAQRGRQVLRLERPHGRVCAWLDGRPLTPLVDDSLSVAHVFALPNDYDSTPLRLTLLVDNRLHTAVGENAHSVSDHTQGNWNGIIGEISICAAPIHAFDEVVIHPSVAQRSIRIEGRLHSSPNPSSRTPVFVACSVNDVPAGRIEVDASGSFVGELALGPDAALWDEFTPTLHTLTVSLANGDALTLRFGLREITARGRQLLLNNRPLFLRGALDCCIFPLTGHPPMDVASWRRILGVIKDHGLNHVRFHSWCPPEAAFVAGDELGLYFQVEAATWPNAVAVLAFNSPAGIGDGASVDAWTYAESERIVRTYGNHPCFVLMASGNEPGGPHHRDYLARWLTHMRAFDPRRLYTGAAGWPELPENQFHVPSEPRAHQWGDGLKSRLNALPPATTADYRDAIARREAPVIAHEIGQWCAYPPLADAAKYTGHLKPKNYAIFADSLAANHLADQAAAFTRASGKLQALCYKEEIESALRTPEMGGFQLLGLQDFPGQGTAPVGVVDAFWDSKGYIAPAAYRRFCHAVVPLARLARRVFTTDDTLTADLELANFGPAPFSVVVPHWRLVDDHGHTLLSAQLPACPAPLGSPLPLGRIEIPLRHIPAPARYRLVVGLGGMNIENDWDVWVYPAALPAASLATPASVTLARSLDEAAPALAAGGRVVLLLPPAAVAGDVALGFTPIFWNTSCTQRQAPHTLGILCDPAHPLFAAFPTDEHANWHWWYLVTRAAALVLDALPPTVRPLVQVIDDWFTNRRLGLVFEARVGAGRLLVCSIDLDAELSANPVARQFRNSLLRYAASDAFAAVDTPEVPFDALRSLVR